MDTPLIAAPAAEAFDIPLDLIDDTTPDGRSVRPSDEAERAMRTSLDVLGQLQNIGLRPAGALGRYPLAYGARRVRAARALGWPTIRAQVREWAAEEIAAIGVAENMLRVPLHPIDQWMAVAGMMGHGISLAGAAAHMGLTERQTKRMQRLSALHPDVLALCRIDMPTDQDLAVIALADAKKQKEAIKPIGPAAEGDQLPWWHVADRCRTARISKGRALFNGDKYPALWEEDLFAQPDDPDRITTSNIGRFMELQRAALTDRIAADRATGRRIELAELGQGDMAMLPVGWHMLSTANSAWSAAPQIRKKPTRVECIFTCVTRNGDISEVLAADVAAKKARDARKVDGDDDPDDTAAEAFAAAVEAPKPAVTAAGMAMIAAAKTEALHAAIRQMDDLRDMLRAMILLCTSDNASIGRLTHTTKQRVAAMLVLPGGQPAELSDDDSLMAVAETVLTEALFITPTDQGMGRGAGPAAEWIGVLAGADGFLERFDTPAFLATVRGDVLKAIPNALGLKGSITVSAIREGLAGHLPEWRPEAAQFGAPAPVVPERDDDDE